ncbi:MAG: TGS domain-containing protein [Chloracidobacterium sp.]|nr:TGS domain-containing protein [Chloracidobacterium sp.]
MSELNIKYGASERAIPAPATVADAIKAFDRDALKSALAAKVNGKEADLNKELTSTDEVPCDRADHRRFAGRP